MYKAIDVAAYIVKLSSDIGEPLTNMKLQKLLYYAYSWYAVEKGEPMFEEQILAWKYGPVVIPVYEAYQKYGAEVIKSAEVGDQDKLDESTKLLVDDVFSVYGNKTAIELMELTHSESPWRDFFNPDFQNTPIPFESIKEFYSEKKKTSEAQNG